MYFILKCLARGNDLLWGFSFPPSSICFGKPVKYIGLFFFYFQVGQDSRTQPDSSSAPETNHKLGTVFNVILVGENTKFNPYCRRNPFKASLVCHNYLNMWNVVSIDVYGDPNMTFSVDKPREVCGVYSGQRFNRIFWLTPFFFFLDSFIPVAPILQFSIVCFHVNLQCIL